MQLLCDLGIFCHGVEKLFTGIFWMAGHKAHQEIAVQLGDHLQKIGKIHAAAQILAVGVHILTQEVNFLAAAGDQLPALSQNILRLPAALPAPHIGHDAVGAEVVTAVHDAHPAFQAAAADNGQTLSNGAGLVFNVKLALFPGEHLVENLRELPQMVG